jgi:hypothetical protein
VRLWDDDDIAMIPSKRLWGRYGVVVKGVVVVVVSSVVVVVVVGGRRKSALVGVSHWTSR